MKPGLFENVAHQMRPVGVLCLIHQRGFITDNMHRMNAAQENPILPAAAFLTARTEADQADTPCLTMRVMITFRGFSEKQSAVRTE